MANLSKEKRDLLLDKIEAIKQNYMDDEQTIFLLNEIQNELTEKKYGLVWERHEERVDEEMKTKIPVFTEEGDKEIIANSNDNRFNFLLEGDNLHSLKLLEKTHKGRIDIIYIDPPYNTGKKDFIYDDKMVGIDDDFKHSKWLSFMNERLSIAQKLLSKKGVIFISIDDYELYQLKLLCDEIFGQNNFVANLSIENNPKGRKNSNFISVSNEYCLIYAKDKQESYFVENVPKNISDVAQDENGNYVHNSGKRVLVGENSFNDSVSDFDSEKHYTVYYNSETNKMVIKKEYALDEIDNALIKDGFERYYSYHSDEFVLNTYSRSRFEDLFKNGALQFKNGKIYEKNFNTMIRLKSMVVNRVYTGIVNNSATEVKIDVKTTSAGTALKELFNVEDTPFSNPKNVGLIKLLLTLIDNKNATILDFFAGSGTTGQAVMELNAEDGGHRKFILCTNNEVDEKIIKEYFIKKNYVTTTKEFNALKGTDKYFKICEHEELQKMGICRSITYPRLKILISGTRDDDSEYGEGMPENLKYYKTCFINKATEDNDFFIEDALLEHIIEMIQLENGIKIDNDKYMVILTDEEAEEFEENYDKYSPMVIYIDSTVFLSKNIIQKLEEAGVDILAIPEYYFASDIKGAN